MSILASNPINHKMQENINMLKLLENLQKDKALFEKRTGKSINENGVQAKSINKREIVERWFAHGTHVIEQRIKSIIGEYLTLDQWPEIQALLMKFSPIWFSRVNNVYVYSDGSIVRVWQGIISLEVKFNINGSISILLDDESAKIYDKLMELGLIGTQV